jgi:hypothetical protein
MVSDPPAGELLGHSTILMTMRYAHLAPEVARETVQLLDLEGPIVVGQSRGWAEFGQSSREIRLAPRNK